MPCAWSIGDILSYGKSTVSFFAPLITSTVGRGGGAGCVTFTPGVVVFSRPGRGENRRAELGAALGAEGLALAPGSGTSMARSPSSNDFLLAPDVCSSAWSTELR